MSVKAYQKLLFSVLSLVYLLPFVQAVVTTVTAKEIMADLHLNPQGMGLLGASFLLPYAASMVCSGMMSAFFGPRKNLTCMFLVAGAGGLIFSSSGSLAVACVGRAMTGIGTAVCLTSSFTLFARWFRAESFARVTGIFFAIGGSGAFFGAAPLAVANAAFGWRWCYAGLGFLTLFYAALVFTVVRDWPTPEDEKTLGVSAAPRSPVTPKMMLEGLGVLSKSWDFWRLVFWFMAMASIYQPFVGLWAAPFFKDVYGLSDAHAGLVVSMVSIGFVAGSPLLNWFCETKLHSNRAAMGAAGAVAAAVFLPLLLIPEYVGRNGAIVAGLALGMALNAPNTLVYASTRNIFGSRLAGVASGLMAGISLVSGASTQLAVSGLLSFATSRGYPAQWAYVLAFCTFIPACVVMMYCGFTLTRASAPGHISAYSWRMILKKEERPETTEDGA